MRLIAGGDFETERFASELFFSIQRAGIAIERLALFDAAGPAHTGIRMELGDGTEDFGNAIATTLAAAGLATLPIPAIHVSNGKITLSVGPKP